MTRRAHFYMDVGDGHEIYVEEHGQIGKPPVIILHGGPGAGTSPYLLRFFDDEFHVIVFDQRGAGRSRAKDLLHKNTSWDLVADIERLRRHFQFEKVMLFGGSWGSTLALLYAEQFPNHVASMILRGVFLGTDTELDWFFGGEIARFFPDEFRRFAQGQTSRDAILQYYACELASDDPERQNKAAQAWCRFEHSIASLKSSQFQNYPRNYAWKFARIEHQYMMNQLFLSPSQAILNNIDAIRHIPTAIVHGQYDMICPPISAQKLARELDNAVLTMVPDAGHAVSERGISLQLEDDVLRMRDMVI